MGTPSSSSLDLKSYQKSSSFFRRLVQSVRLALTDVTLPQLITKEITNRSWRMPEAMLMKSLSKAAFEIDDYFRIIKILHKRFKKFERKSWRKTYKALILLEHLLIYGPKSSREDFETDGEFIKQLRTFQYIDETGYNWGQSMKEKAERVLTLIENAPYHAEERDRLRGLRRDIQLYNSYNLSSISAKDIVEVSYYYGRNNSNCEQHSHEKEVVALHAQNEDPTHDAEKGSKKSTEKGSVVVSRDDRLPEECQPLLADDVDAAFLDLHTKSWIVFT